MNIKLGCRQSTQFRSTWKGYEMKRTYSCYYFYFSLPNEKNEEHDVTCPACRQKITIVIVGEKSAKIRRIVCFILGTLILIPFFLLIIMSFINNGFNSKTIVSILGNLFLGFMFSAIPFFKAIENKFYSKGHTYAPGHKIIYD
jgi:hypothetical protein